MITNAGIARFETAANKFFRRVAWAALFFAITFLLVVIGVLATACLSHASTKQPRRNSLGVEQFYMNPNIYLFGVLACSGENDCSLLKDAKGRIYTNLKFQPFNTPELYEEPVMFCDNVAGAFKEHRGTIVITYRRQASLNYQGIGCHDLISVFDVPAPKEQQ